MLQSCFIKNTENGDFPGGPVVKNPLCNAGDVDLIASQRSKTLQIAEELSPRTTTTEPTHSGDHTAQLGSPCNTRKIPYVTNKTQHSQINKLIFKKRKKKIVCCSLVMFIALMFGMFGDLMFSQQHMMGLSTKEPSI